ncbi:hypothetical protein CLOL250_00786 [Clostridium sp. L2-50]|nr:hypothetical protein CLOL250_00786 [Clostridium sp. L2-50]
MIIHVRIEAVHCKKKKEKGYFASGYMEQKLEYDGYTKQ